MESDGAQPSSSQPLLAEVTTPAGVGSAAGSPSVIAVAVPAAQDASPATKELLASDIYNGGFFVETKDKSFSLYANGLFQVRYTGFVPHHDVLAQGEPTTGTSTFDVFLGRVALSGSVYQPSLKYFLQVQGSTAGNSNTLTMLDWFASNTFSKALTVQVGRSYTPYSYEYYCSPGNYLFADLSTAEYAFALPRAIGAEVYGKVGKLTYAGMVANSIPALDAGGQENFNSKLAYIGHAQVDILAPYGYVETDPSGSSKQALMLWGSAAYNPVNASSGFENVTAGDTTVNATSTAAYRIGYFSLQTSGYWRKTTPIATGELTKNSWGYGEQAGFYLKPKKLELAERISGVNWGAPDNLSMSTVAENTWFVGPGFPYHRVAEDSIGLNYYLHGHNAKIQADYSYVHGNTFTDQSFAASRVRIQTQLMF
ncbi:porin [Granulicella arctica]|uniref:Porin n=1 Tax=Granulicella arctica TaxID=940613 RepID=A0A7Y9PJ01_9BACT|nr:porin [Granulicella arctica]NYF80794.1 hypothetical protein [Granulicella arctica]